MMETFEIKPCPCCGNTSPYSYISSSCVVLRCTCGIGVISNEGAARILYPRASVPAELVPHLYEISNPGNLDPEQDYVAINALAALNHSGALAIWNRRIHNEVL